MKKNTTEDLLKRINYIEADVEIQKQILFSIPTTEKSELERVISQIAAHKKEIDALRQELREQDPEEYNRILVLENAVNEFKEIAARTPFQAIINRNVNEECGLSLLNGSTVDCLIKACDNDENWTIITLDGEIKQYSAVEVAEKPPEKDDLMPPSS